MLDLVRRRSLVEDLAALRDGSVDVRGYVNAVCDRIQQCEPQIHAFVPENGRRHRLLESIESVDAVRDMPLSGVPVGIKDIIRVDGMQTKAGSMLPSGLFAGAQASVVDRLLAAGAVVAGKTVTAEFAVAAPGPTANPHDLRHTPGGSSSGSAAAVAAGMVPLALGTQTIGSVIRPAAYCGVVGFRPSWGRIATDGIIANAPSLDAVGLFAADVSSATLAAAVLCDNWQSGYDADRAPVLGIPVGPFLDRASPTALDTFEKQVKVLCAADFEVRSVPMMDDFDELANQLLVINRYELAQVHTGWYRDFRRRYREQTARAVEQGLMITRRDYTSALQWRGHFIDRLINIMADNDIDLWISPAATGPAPDGLHSTGDPAMCVPYSLAGMPAITLPARADWTELPLGLQCAASLGGDEKLLAWSAIIESALERARPTSQVSSTDAPG